MLFDYLIGSNANIALSYSRGCNYGIAMMMHGQPYVGRYNVYANDVCDL